MIENVDCLIAVQAPENTRETSGIPHDRMAKLDKAYRPAMERVVSGNLAWVGCQFPCPALAPEARMSLRDFEDFLYGACLIDWDAERERMQAVKERLDAADEIRVVGAGTEITLSLAGREGMVDAGGANIPGGEVFYSPGRGFRQRRDRLLGVPCGLRRPRAAGHPSSLRGQASSSTRPPRRKRRTCTRCSTRTRGRAGSARSASAATPG